MPRKALYFLMTHLCIGSMLDGALCQYVIGRLMAVSPRMDTVQAVVKKHGRSSIRFCTKKRDSLRRLRVYLLSLYLPASCLLKFQSSSPRFLLK